MLYKFYINVIIMLYKCYINVILLVRYDDLDIIAGQGTIGLEICEQLGDCDAIIVPVGGAGLIAGVAVAAKNLNPAIKIIVSV